MKRIGLVGLGYIGKAHLEAYQGIENAQVTAVCTRREIKLEEKACNYHGSYVNDYNDLLSNKEIDIIDICLPTYLHEEYILRAAHAGKHIICEKPLTLSEEAAERILLEVNKNNVKLFVGHVLRFWPEYQKIKTLGQANEFQLVHAKRLSQVPKWSNWFQYPEKSGGALFDLHLHDIDFITYLLGEVDSVYAVGTKNQYGAWDHVMTTLTMRNRCKVFAEASHRMPEGFPFTMSFRAHSGQNTIVFDLLAGENIENFDGSNNPLIYYSKHNKSIIPVDNTNAFQNELSYFVNCIENNTVNNVIPLEDVLYTLKVLKAIQSSLEKGIKVQVN